MKRNKQKKFILRMRILFGGIVAVGFVLITNLFYIQIRSGDQFRAQADNQYVGNGNSFERGSIFFEQRDGTRITAAGQKTGYKISINPSTFSEDQDVFIGTITSILPDLDASSIRKNLDRTNRTYIEIAHHIPKNLKDDLESALGSSIQLHLEKWRTYPLQGSAAHLLGFLGYQGDDYAGRYGLERYYEDILRRDDIDLYTNFFARVFHDVDTLVDPEKKPEGDIVTTIDPQVQLYFEQKIENIIDTWSSESVGGIIMNPKTGEIYALGAFPSFDNNNFGDYSLGVFGNPLVENAYEMGSIMKPLVVAMGVDAGDINLNSLEYYDQGFVEVGPHVIKNFDQRGRGWVSVQDILNQSLNTGMVYITGKISKTHFRNYFTDYGFTETTGIDLPNESQGITSNLKSTRDIEFANMSFGQGIAISPIAMVRALSTLANNGARVNPHLVKKIEYTHGFSKSTDAQDEQLQVLKPETSSEVSRLLVNVFDNYQDGYLKIPGYSIAAKTGTAQIPNPRGGYYDDRNLHSFFGYFPAYEPEFIVFLYTVHPKNVKYSSQTLIKPFREITQYLINYYDVAPDR